MYYSVHIHVNVKIDFAMMLLQMTAKHQANTRNVQLRLLDVNQHTTLVVKDIKMEPTRVNYFHFLDI